MIRCYYIDHTFFSELVLGEISEKLKENNIFNNTEHEKLLITCHRIELYTTKEYMHDPLEKLIGHESRSIMDTTNSLKRLIKISTGTSSKILAERFILQQVKEAFSNGKIGNELKLFYSAAIDIANRLRDEYDFHTDLDYNDLALKLFSQSINSEDMQDEVLIIGGGMLAVSIQNTFKKNDNSKISMITRQPKKLKRKVGEKIKVVLADYFVEEPLLQNHKCIIATSNLNSTYVSKLQNIIKNKYCKEIFDFSAVPCFHKFVEDKKYITIYSNQFENMIKVANVNLLESAKGIESAIDKYAENKIESDFFMK
tara:strand:- start:907 stop:1842 length:936 start_codon:yes stop_codon:yes gene_type:complete